jgi:hypothetical protein
MGRLTARAGSAEELTLSPDFEAMRAFEPDEIPDGTEFSKDGVRDLIWRNGDAVPK